METAFSTGSLPMPSGGSAIGVLNLDALPPAAALAEVSAHKDVSSVLVIELPPAGQLPTWLQA